MSPSSSGSEIHAHNYCFEMSDVSEVGKARRFGALICDALDIDPTRAARVGIVINELGNNLVKYAVNGKLLLRGARDNRCVEILSIDSGPGLDNTVDVMTDGFTTGDTPGTGLGAVRRQSDVFDIYSMRGQGTVIVSIIRSHDEEPTSHFHMGVVSVPYKDEIVCGDGWAIHSDEKHIAVLVADGLGHGVHAHEAALEACRTFDTKVESHTLEDLLKVTHSRLKSTRGAAVFFLKVPVGEQVQFTGAGNVRAVIKTHENMKALLSQNGTAGVQVRSSRALSVPWDEEGFIILHTDGIMSRWDLSKYPGLLHRNPALAAAVIYRDFNRTSDDATVLVIGRRS